MSAPCAKRLGNQDSAVHGRGLGAGSEGWEPPFLSTGASPRLLQPPHSMVAGCAERVSQDTGRGSCPFPTAWVRALAVRHSTFLYGSRGCRTHIQERRRRPHLLMGRTAESWGSQVAVNRTGVQHGALSTVASSSFPPDLSLGKSRPCQLDFARK